MQKILVIEDEHALLNAISEKLEREGFQVIAESNPALGLARAMSEKPDLILLDIVMPEMDGLTLLGKLRADDWGRNARVMMLTNLSDAHEVAKAQSRGVYDYLVKTDWKLSDVVEAVRNRLAK